MAEKLSRDDIKELIGKLRVKQEPSYDLEALGSLAKNTQGSSPDQLAMIMMMMAGNQKGGGGMEKFMEIQMGIAAMKALQNLNGGESDTKGFKELMQEIQKQREEDNKRFQDMFTKKEEAEREERRHRETIEMIQKMSEASKEKNHGQVDPMTTLMIEMIKDREKVSPLDIYDRVQKNTADTYLKQMEMEKQHAKEKQEMQDLFMERMQAYADSHSGNRDAMAELGKATETIGEFQNFAKRLGWVSPTKEEGSDDKLDWRFLLNRALDIATNVSGAVNKPKRNSQMMDVSKEADRLYSKFKDNVEKPDHTPIDKQWLAQQLQSNPNLERDWDRALAEYNRQNVSQPAREPIQQASQQPVEQIQEEPEVEIEEPESESTIEQASEEIDTSSIYGKNHEGM